MMVKYKELSNLCGHDSEIIEYTHSLHAEDHDSSLRESQLSTNLMDMDSEEIIEHKPGGLATNVIPTHIEGEIIDLDLVEPLDIRGEFEGLSLLEAHMVGLTFFGPAYERVYIL